MKLYDILMLQNALVQAACCTLYTTLLILLSW